MSKSQHMKVYIEKLYQGGGSHLGGDLETTRHHGTLIFTEMQEDTHIFHLKKLDVASPSECRVLIRNVHGPPFCFVCFLTVSPLLRTPPLTKFLNKCFHIFREIRVFFTFFITDFEVFQLFGTTAKQVPVPKSTRNSWRSHQKIRTQICIALPANLVCTSRARPARPAGIIARTGTKKSNLRFRNFCSFPVRITG